MIIWKIVAFVLIIGGSAVIPALINNTVILDHPFYLRVLYLVVVIAIYGIGLHVGQKMKS